MATTIAKGVVEIGIDPKYIQQLNGVRANLVKFSKGVTQALKPISLALGAFGGLAIKQALAKNEESALKWHRATDKVNVAMAGVGDKILKASFAGKTLFQWMDKFAQSINKLTQGDVQKLVDSFLIINGVLLAMKGLKIAGGLAGSAATAGKAITAKEMIGAEVAGGGIQALLTKRAVASEIRGKLFPDALPPGKPTSELLRSRALNAFEDAKWQRMRNQWTAGSAPGSVSRALIDLRREQAMAAAAKLKEDAGMLKGATGGWFARGASAAGVSTLTFGAAITALFATVAGAIAGGIRAARGAWDNNKGTFANIFDELGTYLSGIGNFVGEGMKGLELIGRILGRLQRDPLTNPRVKDIVAEMNRRGEVPDVNEDDYVGPTGMTTADLQKRGRKGMEEARKGMDLVLLKEALEEKARKFEKDSMDWQERNKANIERKFARKQEIEENLKKSREEMEDMEVEFLNTQIDLAEQMKEKFTGKPGTIGFYNAEESYKAATGWQAELLQYEKEKKEFEKEKAKKQQAMVDRLIEIKGNGDKLGQVFEKLVDEANAYNVR